MSIITIAKKKAMNLVDTTLYMLKWGIEHPKLTLLMGMNFIIANNLIPVLARVISQYIIQLDCGTFSVRNIEGGENYSYKQVIGNNLCLFPLRDVDPNSRTLFCYLGNDRLFDSINPDENYLKIAMGGNPELTICDQFATEFPDELGKWLRM